MRPGRSAGTAAEQVLCPARSADAPFMLADVSWEMVIVAESD